MTRKYELLYVLNGTLPADVLKTQLDRVKAIVEASAEIIDITEWGRRRLAYEIQDIRDGYYVIVHFNAEPDAPKEIERLLRISDAVLRYLIVLAEGTFMPVSRRSLDDEIKAETARSNAVQAVAVGQADEQEEVENLSEDVSTEELPAEEPDASGADKDEEVQEEELPLTEAPREEVAEESVTPERTQE